MAEKEFGSEVILVSKTSREYQTENNPPPCPSVAVDTIIVVQDGIIAYENLKTALLKTG